MTTTGVRTYHARRGRMGPTARSVLAELLPTHGVDPSGDLLDPAVLFGRPLPMILEIGCGMGETTLALARAEPDVGILAADVHPPGIAAVLAACRDEQLDNVRVVLGDAVALVADRIPPNSLAGIVAFFPDPWPKARQAKRRLIRPDLVQLLASRLRPGATLHTATDQPAYAEQMLAVLSAEPLLENSGKRYAPRPAWRPITRFERRALTSGGVVRDLRFRRGQLPSDPEHRQLASLVLP